MHEEAGLRGQCVSPYGELHQSSPLLLDSAQAAAAVFVKGEPCKSLLVSVGSQGSV